MNEYAKETQNQDLMAAARNMDREQDILNTLKAYQEQGSILESELIADPDWVYSSKVLFEFNEGKPFEGDDQAAASYGLNEMTSFNSTFFNVDTPWSETDSQGMAEMMFKLNDAGDHQKVAFAYLHEMFDMKDWTIQGVGRTAQKMTQDPLNLVGLGLPIVFVARYFGRQAAKEAVKYKVRQWAGNIVNTRAGLTGLGAVEGAAFFSADDAMRQDVENQYADATGRQEQDFDYMQNLKSAGSGALFGSVLVNAPMMLGKIADNLNPGTLFSGIDPTAIAKGILDDAKEFVGIDTRAHGLPSKLLIVGNGEKPTTLIPQAWGPQNARSFTNIDSAKVNNPLPLTSTDTWKKFWQESAGGDALPAPPYRAIEYMNNPQAIVDKLSQLRPELKAAADEGFGHLREINNLYTNGTATPQDTGNLFSWAFLSRGAGPYQQEGAYADLLTMLQPYIEKAINGQFTAKDLKTWKKEVAASIPEGSPGRSVIHNANALGTFLQKVGTPLESENGSTALSVLHNMMTDGSSTTAEIRRKFFDLAAGSGIDTKVFSFALLYRGDVFVMDRIQGRHFWDDGTFDGANIYDGIKSPTATGNQRSEGLVSLLGGPRGVAIYEMLEEGLAANVAEAYKMMGREADGSLARFHWESWLVEGNQAVDHGSLRAIYDDTPGTARVREGKPGNFKHGSIYMNLNDEKVVLYPDSTGANFEFTPKRYDELIDFIKKPKNGIIPSGFKVSMNPDKSPRLEAWFNDPEVNRQKLDEAIKQFGTEWSGPDVDGSTGFIQTDTSDLGRQAWRDYAIGRGR